MSRGAESPDGGCYYDHVDFRVRNMRAVRGFYDAFMKALGFTKVSGSASLREYCNADPTQPFFGVRAAARANPAPSRIAFGAPSRAAVDRVAAAIRCAGARAVDGPQVCRSYRQPYYAVFFEDPEGNRFEVCCRR